MFSGCLGDTPGRYPWAIENALKKYGDVVRIAPNELVFITPQATIGELEYRNHDCFILDQIIYKAHRYLFSPQKEHRGFYQDRFQQSWERPGWHRMGRRSHPAPRSSKENLSSFQQTIHTSYGTLGTQVHGLLC